MKRFDSNACFGHFPYWSVPHRTADDLVSLMDRHGIERAVCLSLRGLFVDWRRGNEETLAAAARHRGRLVPAVTISPFLGGNGDELRRLIRAGARMVRLYPSFHNYRLDDPFVDDICASAAEGGVPVMIPTRIMMNWRFAPLSIDAVGVVIERHPATRFILSGPNYLVEYQALVRLMKRSPNVSYELSCLQGFHAVRNLVDEIGAERILFGTGAVLQYPACNVAKLENADVTEEQRRAIACDNIARWVN